MDIQIIMSKRPFNKIRKIQKKENIQATEENNEDFNQQQRQSREKDSSKPAIFNPANKKRINIINPDALKTNEDNHHEPEPKISLGSKPNLFKGKRQGNKLLIPPRDNPHNVNNDPVEQSYGDVPKPTPLVIKKRHHFDNKSREREHVVIQEEQQSMGYRPQQSKELKADQSSTVLKKPDLKIKRLGPRSRRDVQKQQAAYEESQDYTGSRDGPLPVQSYDPVPIQYRQINIEPQVGISEGKLDKQQKRSLELSNLLNLQPDLYQQMLSIGNITSYEIYINKIKGGFLKNSQDQAFDEKVTNSCQTLSFEYADFTNQCPQDYAIDINKIQNLDGDNLFDSFILKVAPVIEELIQPTNTITDPPIFLLAFRPTFKAFYKCPYPLFVYHSQQFHLDLIVVGQKLYITEGEIESVLMIGKSMIAGLKNGYLIHWNGQNSRSSRLYQQIKEFTNTTNFQLPSFCTHHLEKFSPYASQFSIVSLLHEERNEFMSLDSGGKVVKWEIQQLVNGSQALKPVSVVQLKNLVQRPTLKAYSIKKRGLSYYISTSMGLLVLQNNQIRQRLQISGQKIVQFQMPKRYPLVFAITASNNLHIYNQLYSHPLMSMNFSLGGDHLTQIIIPELQHDNREIIILSVMYLTDTAGKIYEVKLLENQYEHVQKMGDEDHDGRKDKNVIFRGVNQAGQTLETLRLMRDLKVTKIAMRMGVNTEKSVSNLKSIIERNRELMTLLEEQNAMIV